MNGRTRLSLQIRFGSRLERESHRSQESQPTPKRGMAESWCFRTPESRCVRVFSFDSMKDRTSIGVGDRLSQRFVLVDHLAAMFGDFEGSVAFMRQYESLGSQSTRIRIECK